jgi:NAD(P)-dependent dehydrogenase (short-subunit alcohol dehydrogenase family)
MTREFDGRVAVVTGAAGGFGLAVARSLAAAGGKVVMVDRAAAELYEQAAAISGALPVVADVSREDEVDDYVHRAVTTYGRVDMFFNNAGIEGRMAPLTEQPAADFDRVMAVNTRGVFLGLRAVLRVMKEQRTGAIVNTSSTAGVKGSAMFGPYVASKHAVVGLTRSAALEAAPFGVRVNCIAPGWADTPMVRKITEQVDPDDPAGVIKRVSAESPLGRLGTAQEIANLAVWLLSDDASYVTGAVHVIDGARTA